MKRLSTLLFLIAITLTSYSQDKKVYSYEDGELIEKPAPTREFIKWLKENNEKIGKSAPHSSKKTTKVTLVFLVDEEGNITNPKIWRGIGQGYDQYAHKLFIENPNKWSPGKTSNSEPVVTEVYYQVDFFKNKNKIMNKNNFPIN